MPDIPEIYIESGPFIDLAKLNANIHYKGRELDMWFLQKLLDAARAGEVKIWTSHLTVAECTSIGEPTVADEVKRFYTELLESGKGGVTLTSSTYSVIRAARDLRWKDNIRLGGADSIHVASALAHKCEEFLTFDQGILDFAPQLLIKGLRCIKPQDTKKLPGHYVQYSLEEESTLLVGPEGIKLIAPNKEEEPIKLLQSKDEKHESPKEEITAGGEIQPQPLKARASADGATLDATTGEAKEQEFPEEDKATATELVAGAPETPEIQEPETKEKTE